MTQTTVLSVRRGGGWSGFHRIYYAAAIESYRGLENTNDDVVEMHGLVYEGRGDLLHEFLEKLTAFTTLANTTQIYCAMCVEALLNFYGVIRLGEAFYKRNFERLGIIPKLELLVAVCDNRLLAKGAEISVVLRRLAENRNALVHPKSREVDVAGLPNSVGIVEAVASARKSIENMKSFIKLFREISDDANAAVDFWGDIDQYD